MVKLRNPILFSRYFDIPNSALSEANLLDPFLNADTKLFIDPLLLSLSAEPLISKKAVSAFRQNLSNIMQLILASQRETDQGWKSARRLLNLNERRETCLGYGGASVSGSSRPASLKDRILRTSRDVMQLGIDNPEIISLMGILEDDVGPDTISDLTTNSILRPLQELTLEFCRPYSVPTANFQIEFDEYELPINPADSSHGFLLVPKDILRELPVATDWSNIDRVVQHNALLRHKVNAIITDIAKATVREKKRALKRVILGDPDRFEEMFRDLLGSDPKGYDFEKDKKSIESLRKLLLSVSRDHPLQIVAPKNNTITEMRRIVVEIIDQFTKLIENNNLSELLWNGSTPKSEKAAQLVFFGVAESYCKANNIDISPEVHSGGGPVDFKFSSGYAARLLVEIKLSKGKVVQGYQTQVEVYKAASNTEEAVFLVIDVGQMGRKMNDIQKIKADREAAGQKATEIFLVNAKKQPSASKR